MFIYKFMAGVVREATADETEEGENFDPHEHRKIDHPTTYIDTMIHLLKGSLGAGILAMPSAVGRVGIGYAIVGVMVIGVFATYCLQMLIHVQYKLCQRWRRGYIAYPKTMRLAIKDGPPALRWSAHVLPPFVDFVLIVWQLGLCCVYIIFVAENTKQVCDFYGEEYSIRLHICFELLPLLVVNMVKNLKMLTPLSTISNVVTFIGLILVFFYLVEDDVSLEADKWELKGFIGVPVFIGTTLFALEAVGVVLALEYNMENPKQFVGLFGLLNLGMAIILILYTLVGVFGYIKYGEEIAASITLNLPSHEKKAQATKLLFALAIFLSCPLQNFVAYNILWRQILKRLPPGKHQAIDYTLRLFLIVLPWSLAVAVPRLGPFISLFGAVCLSLLAIIFPAFVDLCLWYPNRYGVGHYKLHRDIVIMLVGSFCLVSGCYTTILEITEH